MEPQQPTSILKATDYGHQNQTPPGDEPPPNLPPRKASRPRLQLPALKIPSRPTMAPPTAGTATTAGTVTWGPAHHGVGHHGHAYLGQPYYPNMPMTPTSGVASGLMAGPTGVPIGMAGALGRFNVYPTKASEFMFKQFAGFKDFTMNTAKIGLSHGEKTAFWLHGKVSSWSRRWFTHIFLFLVVFAYSLLGALLFVAIEGTNEERYRVKIHDEREAYLKTMYSMARNTAMVENEDAWTTEADHELEKFVQELRAHFKNGEDNQKEKVWTLWNAVFYCGTIYTTIGYGHISPSTTTGRAVTIIYAIIGIPMFLILLADFGKLFTRGIKFVWSFVRRLYYTGSCRQVRRTQPVQEIMKGAQIVYDLATFRRPSMFPQGEPPEDVEGAETPLRHDQPTFRRDAPDSSEPPATPAPSAFEVDDEFNLPISVAIVILLLYMFVGASIYYIWESWGFFESFYFVFISMSTIGFGDFVPKHPMYMMASIVYLVFGLALTSMCINVVQEKLSDSFRQASAKIGATIGLRIAEQEEGSTNPPTPGNGQVQDDEHHAGQGGQEGSPYSMHNGAREVPS
ncbi:TWiK family of potassium channels protein 18 isoform X2 [Thrips palmi]|uniref:TWiK family of potassium channels protein 18 isoform X2 n=1 Tax=Thrips palmi TaxID=161013 RepID=A0A6P9AA23_THRPL|nr:TWiK family of potassium channels protein 18 isoform X2 [Thrips palmi]